MANDYGVHQPPPLRMALAGRTSVWRQLAKPAWGAVPNERGEDPAIFICTQYIYIYIYIYVCVYICIYIYIYIYIYIDIDK